MKRLFFQIIYLGASKALFRLTKYCRKGIIFKWLRGVAQLGRALRSGRRGRRFKSCHLDQYNKRDSVGVSFVMLLLRQELDLRRKGPGEGMLFVGVFAYFFQHFASQM